MQRTKYYQWLENDQVLADRVPLEGIIDMMKNNVPAVNTDMIQEKIRENGEVKFMLGMMQIIPVP